MLKKIALLTAGALILAACGGAAATTEAEESGHDETVDREVEIVMGGENEFSFTPATITVSAGETIRFVVTNNGQIEHEFRPTTVEEAEEHLASGHDDHEEAEEDEAAEEEHAVGELLIQPGETQTLEVTFEEAGEYTIYACLLPGHYEAGMVGDFVYEG